MVLPETIRELLENGVHFGHLRKHWNPKMKKFIYGRKKNVYIIDLEKTVKNLQEAQEFVRKVARQGEKILFVSTKRQARDVIKEAAEYCSMPYVVDRWIGGMLTNFSTIKERIKEYVRLKEKYEKGEFSDLTKKEAALLEKKIKKMANNYAGVVSLEELPGCLFIVDPKREITAVKEANRLGIPIVSLIDTDGDPDVIDYPIPGNDDAMKSIRYISFRIAEAIKEGLEEAGVPSQQSKSEKEADVEITAEEEKIAEEFAEEFDEKIEEEEQKK